MDKLHFLAKNGSLNELLAFCLSFLSCSVSKKEGGRRWSGELSIDGFLQQPELKASADISILCSDLDAQYSSNFYQYQFTNINNDLFLSGSASLRQGALRYLPLPKPFIKVVDKSDPCPGTIDNY